MSNRKSYGETGEMRVTRSHSKLKDPSQDCSPVTATCSAKQQVLSGAPAANPASSFKKVSQADKISGHREKPGGAGTVGIPKPRKTINRAELEDNLCTDTSSQPQAVIGKILGPEKRPPCPASSLKNMSQTEYKVMENLRPILANILQKYGDITENSIMETAAGKSFVLEKLCEFINRFQEKKLDEVEFEEAVGLVTDFERLGLKVDWLKAILETRKVIKQPTSLKKARGITNQVINKKKRKLKRYEAEMAVSESRMVVFQEKMAMLQENVRLTKEELHEAENKAERIKEMLSNAKAKAIYYEEHALLDELF